MLGTLSGSRRNVGPRAHRASLIASQMASLARACTSSAEGMSEQSLARACASKAPFRTLQGAFRSRDCQVYGQKADEVHSSTVKFARLQSSVDNRAHLNRDGLLQAYDLRPVCARPKEAVDLIPAPLPAIQGPLCHMNQHPAAPSRPCIMVSPDFHTKHTFICVSPFLIRSQGAGCVAYVHDVQRT